MEGSLAVFPSIWPLAVERSHFSGPCATALVGTFTSAAIPLQACDDFDSQFKRSRRDHVTPHV